MDGHPANVTMPAGTSDFKALQIGETKSQPKATAGSNPAVASQAILRLLRKSIHAS
jgi:hypothetical protein